MLGQTGLVSISTGTSDNDKLVTQGYVDDNAGGATTFLALTDTPGSYTTGNAIYNVNSGATAVNETTTLLTEPAANQFQIARGTTELLVQTDCTINQDLQTSASPTFANLTISVDGRISMSDATDRNVLVGRNTGAAITTGNNNTFVGDLAGEDNTTGLFNSSF